MKISVFFLKKRMYTDASLPPPPPSLPLFDFVRFSMTPLPSSTNVLFEWPLGYVYFYPYAITSFYTFCSHQEQTWGCLLNRWSLKIFQKTFSRNVEILFQMLMVLLSANSLVSFCPYCFILFLLNINVWNNAFHSKWW